MMTVHEPTCILLLGSEISLAETLDAWFHAHFSEPLHIASVHALPDALAYLQTHHVDLVLTDEAASRTELRTIHRVSPATAIIALVMRMEESVFLHALRQGAHEVLCLLPSAEGDHLRAIERALARVNGRTGILNPATCRPAAAPRLIHDLNNLLTSINGFADLLLSQLAPDHPARVGAEQIRLAGRRATTLLKTHAPASAPPATSARSDTMPPPITVRAA